MSNLTHRLTKSLFTASRDCIHYEGLWYSTLQLENDMATVMILLKDAGVCAQDRVVLDYPNSYAFLVAYLAILHSGAVVVPVNPELKPAELQTILKRSQAEFGFFHTDVKATLDAICEHNSDIALSVIFTSSELQQGAPQFVWSDKVGGNTIGDPEVHAVLRATRVARVSYVSRVSRVSGVSRVPGVPREVRQVSDDNPAVLMYTSGTTGRPKAVVLKHRHLLAAAENIIDAHNLTQADVVYCFLPLFHINAQVVAVLSTLLSGGRIVLAPRFSASRFWNTIEDHKVTWVSAVPTVISILQNGDGPDIPPASLRFVRSASAQLPQLVALRFERRFGIPVIQSYGMTEAASQICVNPLPPGERRSDSVGLPMGVELRIVDENGTDVPSGAVGEVVLRGPNVIEAYEDAPNQNDFRDGWFYTGDMGRRDTSGYVYLTGRKKELINRAGEKISPYEVEDVIREIPEVEQVAVIGLPDALYGEQVAAYVVPRGSTCAKELESLANEILRACRQALSKYKWPSGIEFVAEIPVGPTGKVQRTNLKQQILSSMIS